MTVTRGKNPTQLTDEEAAILTLLLDGVTLTSEWQHISKQGRVGIHLSGWIRLGSDGEVEAHTLRARVLNDESRHGESIAVH